MVVNIHAAKTQLSQLLVQVQEGEEIIIAKAGRPIAKLIPFHSTPAREPGLWKEVSIPPSFFDPLPDEELAAWEQDAS